MMMMSYLFRNLFSAVDNHHWNRLNRRNRHLTPTETSIWNEKNVTMGRRILNTIVFKFRKEQRNALPQGFEEREKMWAYVEHTFV